MKVLYVWELGGGMGHISRAAPIIEGLRQAGHEVYVALRDLSGASALLHSLDVRLLQCPLWLPQLKGAPESATYAELLFRAGFAHPVALEGLTRAWLELFRLIDPALLVADHAPNAFLAARGSIFRRALIGNGFFSPPRQSPLPSFRTWETIHARRIESADAHALSIANKVLERLALPRLERLCDLLDIDEDFLCTWPELDHYPLRSGQRYWGPTMERQRGAMPSFPSGAGPRVFCYINAECKQLDALLTALQRSGLPSLLFVPGISAQQVRALSGKNLKFSAAPLRMDQTLAEADIVVSHAGEGTVAAAMLAGKPQLVLPMHAEQMITALNVARSGAGLYALPDMTAEKIQSMIGRLAEEADFGRAATTLAQKYASFAPEDVCKAMVARCQELLALGPRK